MPSTTLPLLPAVDVAVIGGDTAAIAAALTLHAQGVSVLVIAGRTYLGEDICDPLRLALPADLSLEDPLARQLYGPAVEAGTTLRPTHLKLELERALRQAGIPFLLSCAPGDVLRNAAGDIAGFTVCSRSGRQALPCRAILDGTRRAEVVRLAGIPLTPPDPITRVVRRVIGGEVPLNGGGGWVQEGVVSFELQGSRREAPLWAFTTEACFRDGSWAAWMDVEQTIRMTAYRPGQDQSADGIDAFTGERLMEGTVSTAGDRIWLTGPGANVSDSERAALVRPDGAIAWGRRIAGLLAAALRPAEFTGLCTIGPRVLPANLEARDLAVNAVVSEQHSAHVSLEEGGFAEVLEVDVLVVGGGTGGAPAGISAARAGASVLVAEFLSGLGGVGTLGLIGKYWFGNRVGFTAEVDREVRALSPRVLSDDSWDVEAKMQWYHEQITFAGGRVWYKTMACGALREGGRVVGAILGTPQGRIAVRARCVVDATGSADVASAAGAETIAIGDAHLAVQGTGLPPRAPGANYTNTDYDFIDDSNVRDSSSAFASAREKFAQAFDVGQLIDSRERRRIVGDYEVTPLDIRLARVFPDTITKAISNFDTHGFTVHPLFLIVPPDHDARTGYIPLRALLPRGLDGILVTGLGISAHRDAMPVIRMQADVQNQGFAAGLVAAAARDGRVRALDVRAIQEKLAAAGVLDPGIVGAADSFPLPAAEIEAALAAAPNDREQIDRVFTLPAAERTARLRAAHAAASDAPARRFFAFVLAVLGDATGADDLAAEVAETPWDEGWNYRGMGQFGRSMSELDARIIALGRCGGARALEVLIAKAGELPADAEFSHYRALAEAFEANGDPAATPALAELLARPGIGGHSQTNLAGRLARVTANSEETAVRNAALIEIHLARALFRLDPAHPLGRATLEDYRRDQRGLFARHAAVVLDDAR